MVDPLPLVKARVEVPPTSVAPVLEQQVASLPSTASEAPATAQKAQEPSASIDTIKASALKGQVLSWWLIVSNAGKGHLFGVPAFITLPDLLCDLTILCIIEGCEWAAIEGCTQAITLNHLALQESFLSRPQWSASSSKAVWA